jgi:hypothetical protein
MKTSYLFIFSAVVALNLASQTHPLVNAQQFNIPGTFVLKDSALFANNFTQVTKTYVSYSRKGKAKNKKQFSTLIYNSKGYLVSSTDISSKTKKTSATTYTYLSDTLLRSYSSVKNGKTVVTTELKRNADQSITDVIEKDSKGKQYARLHYDYDPQLKRISRTNRMDKNDKEVYAVEYLYYDEKNLKEAKEFRKGKLKKVWNYTCDPAGTNEKKVKQLQVCKSTSVDKEGNKIESKRVVNEKGEVDLYISTYDKNEKIIAQKVYDDVKHILLREYENKIVNGNVEFRFTSYTKKGKQALTTKSVNSPTKRLLLTESSYEGKHLWTTIFSYNAKDLLVGSVSTTGKENRKAFESFAEYK